jgi:hypothetical protein
MLLAHRCWDDMSQARKIGITALALPGWTVGLPLVVLYFLRSSDGADWDGSSE